MIKGEWVTCDGGVACQEVGFFAKKSRAYLQYPQQVLNLQFSFSREVVGEEGKVGNSKFCKQLFFSRDVGCSGWDICA